MAEYPRPNRSPFFKTFQGAQRVGNVMRNRPHLTQRAAGNNIGGISFSVEQEGSIAHYTLPPMTHQMAQQVQPSMQQMQPAQPIQPSMQRMQPAQSLQAPAQRMQPAQQPAQAAPSAPAFSPVAPENAAERFQQVNRSLPDGVRFEPLDEETKVALKKLGMAPPAPPPHTASIPQKQQPDQSTAQNPPLSQSIPQNPPHNQSVPQHPQIPPNHTAIRESAPLLEQLIQNERNASVYYQHLSGIAPSENFREVLQGIARDCEERRSQYQQLLQKLHDRIFEPKDTQINTTVDFDRGIEVAVAEERKILESMAELVEQLEDKTNAGTMQNLINKRMIQLNWLQWTMFQLK